MSENQAKSEIAPQKRSLKLAPALGDWTTYKPVKAGVKKIKSGLYGFDRLSEEEFKLAHRLHYNFAEKLLARLSSALEAGIEFYSIDALQSSYASFIKGFTNQVLQGAIESAQKRDNIFFSFDMPLAEAFLGHVLGSKSPVFLKREFTEAENLSVQTMVNEYLGEYSSIFNFNNRLKALNYRIVASPFITPDPTISEQSSYVQFKIKLSLGGTHGSLIMGYPSKFLKSLIQKSAQIPSPTLALNKLSQEMQNAIKLSLKAILGSTTLTTHELLGLETGDVLQLDNSIHHALSIITEDGKVLLGQPGIKGNHLALKIVKIEKEAALRIAPPELLSEASLASNQPPEETLPEVGFPAEEAGSEEELFGEEENEAEEEFDESLSEEEENEEEEEEEENEDEISEEDLGQEDFNENEDERS